MIRDQNKGQEYSVEESTTVVRISTTKGGSESVQKRVVSTSTTEGGSESVQKSGQDHHKKKKPD